MKTIKGSKTITVIFFFQSPEEKKKKIIGYFILRASFLLHPFDYECKLPLEPSKRTWTDGIWRELNGKETLQNKIL